MLMLMQKLSALYNEIWKLTLYKIFFNIKNLPLDIEGIETGEAMDCLCCLEGDPVRMDLMLGGRLFTSTTPRASRIQV